MWELIAEGPGYALASVVGYEDQVAEEQRAKLSMSLHNPLDSITANQLQQQLTSAGVADAEVRTYGSNVDVIYRKGFPWLAVIIAIILGLIALAILIISWRFSKEAPLGFSLLTIGAILVGVAAVIYLVRRQT